MHAPAKPTSNNAQVDGSGVSKEPPDVLPNVNLEVKASPSSMIDPSVMEAGKKGAESVPL